MNAIIKKYSRGWRVKFTFDGDAPDLYIDKYYTRYTTAFRAAKRAIVRMRNESTTIYVTKKGKELIVGYW